MKFISLFLLFFCSWAKASLFTSEEASRLASGGQNSIVQLTRAHFDAHKNTGVGLYYGFKSAYSPVRPAKSNQPAPILMNDSQRATYIKSSLRETFKQNFANEEQLDAWVQKTVGDQDHADTRNSTGSIHMTSCILWVIEHLESAYKSAGKEARWKQIRETLKKDPKGADRGLVLLDELQKDGWEAVYWNPDVRFPDEYAARRSWHVRSAIAAKKVRGYYPTWYTSENPPPANEYIKIDHFLVDYNPHAKRTKKISKGLESLKRVPFWVGIANFGEHSFVGYYDNISEAHSPLMPTDRDNIELSKFETWGTAWAEKHNGQKYLSGVIMVPPGTWQD